MTNQNFALLTVQMFAAGTYVRTGTGPEDYTPIEELSTGEAIYDPLSGRFHDIIDMSCGTLDRSKARARGMDMLTLPAAGNQRPLECLVESRDMASDGMRRARPQDSGSEREQVFYGMRFRGRVVVVDTGAVLCEMR
jgi:hypothetical protein